MPTERFYRLPEEKRRTIRNAAFHEFARVSVEKASINQIIKEAEISRGSFYTYFEDKWDVLAYIFEESQTELKEFLYYSLETLNGDIWKTLDAFFVRVVEVCSGEERRHFIKNVMRHADMDDLFGEVRRHQRPNYETAGEDVARWVYKHYSREVMREMSFREFHEFFLMAIAAIAMEIRRFFDGKTLDEVRESYRMKLRLLWQGVAPVSGSAETEK